MNYYKRHLGDYARKAGHLSMLEHGAYNLILDAYYDREVPPTRAEAIRFARARSAEEVAAVDVVLAEFFTETDGRYVQGRVEREFEEAAIQADKNRDNGKKGGRPRKAAAPSTSEEPKKTQSVISDNPSESQKNPNPLIHQSITEQEQKRALAAPTPAELFPDVDPGHLRDWMAARKAKRLPLTETAAKGFRRAAEKAGMTAAEAVQFCAERGWAGLHADFKKPRAGPAPAHGGFDQRDYGNGGEL